MASRILALVAALPLLLAGAQATGAALFNTPVQDPETGNWYELVRPELCPQASGYCIDWNRARTMAAQRVHNGIVGRLAVVNTAHLHQFLIRTFAPSENTWIGLRYWCQGSKLQWVDGTVNGRYAGWAQPWNQSAGAGCLTVEGLPQAGEGPYMPVAIDPTAGQRWVAKGARKVYPMFFVEYPVKRK